MTGILFFALCWSVLMAVFNASGFALGQTYDYTKRKKTYHGTKLIFWSAVTYGIYKYMEYAL